jgi:hypothetical protein
MQQLKEKSRLRNGDEKKRMHLLKAGILGGEIYMRIL